MVAQVVQLGPGLVGADGRPARLGVGQGLLPGCDPQPMQDPPVPGIGTKPSRVSHISQAGDLSEQGHQFQ